MAGNAVISGDLMAKFIIFREKMLVWKKKRTSWEDFNDIQNPETLRFTALLHSPRSKLEGSRLCNRF